MTIGVKMKCMFNPTMECTVYNIAKELEPDLKPTDLLEKACPLCPKRPLPQPPERLEK